MRPRKYTGRILALYIINSSYILEIFDREKDFIDKFPDMELIKVWFDVPDYLSSYYISKVIGFDINIVDKMKSIIESNVGDENYIVGHIDSMIDVMKFYGKVI